MWSRLAVVAIALGAVPVGGCAEPEGEVGASVDNVTEKDIDFQVWEAPLELTPGVQLEASVAYGECERVEPSEENVDIEINCGRAWAEVAWYRISSATIEQLAPSGSLSIEFGVGADSPLLRGSIHRVTDAGKVKLTSRSMIFEGDRLQVPIEEIADHYVYVARGDSLINVWGTGELNFSVALPSAGD